MSVLEVAQLTIRDGNQSAFEADFANAHRYVQEAEGHLSSELRKSTDTDTNYVFLVEWQRLEDHIEVFAASPEFAAFQSVIGPHLAGEPSVEHYEKI
ncbi:antibiotic biosynthesis monooxygenase family protein [uncultured Leifsonia sp.]|uniref:antibiotic biosynthesis monooxygenase family protein n=1 Tax=uncultured Leifsonia sp. TaxID=340359 RepID=UPI0028D50962|nr:antibiotic biosynthesis monooxygenase family protein [uncultured Leifsonia sp.]